MKNKTTIAVLPFLLGMCIFILPSFAIAQSKISGTITDAKTNEVIIFANVILTSKGKQVATTTSDVNGNYHLQSVKNGRYELSVVMIGYEPYVAKNIFIKGTETQVHNIKLSPSSSELKSFSLAVEKRPPSPPKEAMIMEMADSEEISISEDANWSKSTGVDAYYSAPIMKRSVNTITSIPSNESYAKIAENEFKYVNKNPLSTFSIDVDAASYANIRRFINQGSTPPIDAVRIEEMINYFSYDYPQPKDKHPFSITTEMAACPWNPDHKLIHVGIQGEKIETEKLPNSNLVFLIDVSGSMNQQNKLPLLKQSFKMLVNNLQEDDRIAIVVYAGAAGAVLPSTSGKEKGKILAAIDRLAAGGSTAGGAGINLAYNIAQQNFIKEGNNRIILATDGDFNVGASSDAAMKTLIEQKRESGISITVLGYGMGNYKDSKMEQIADHGNGNYAYIDNLMEAKKVLVSEMNATLHTIAKDVKIQVEFNPSVVSSYKLIGYENRMLKKEDFNDDTKDAGELGAGHTVTALYEVAIVGMGGTNPNSVDPLRYQEIEKAPEVVKIPSHNDEILTVKFRYKKPKESSSILITKYLKNKDTDEKELTNNFKFSASVAEFGLILRNSKFKGTASCDHALQLAKSGKGQDDFGYRAEFIRMVELFGLRASK